MRFFVGEEQEVIAQEAHLFLKGVKHLNEERVGKVDIQFTGKDHSDQTGFLGGQCFR
ncbi:hypothetical protein D3C76_1808680 [compost metagenome]